MHLLESAVCMQPQHSDDKENAVERIEKNKIINQVEK
jgi:hypothetical protein